MKKWLALLLAILCVIGFASCKDESSKEKKKTSTKEEKTEDMTDTRLYSFLHEGVSVIPGDDAKASLAALTHLQLDESAQGSCLGGVDGEDVVYYGAGLLAMHAHGAGKKTLKLPRALKVTPLTDGGETIFTDTVCFDIEEFETKIFKLSE